MYTFLTDTLSVCSTRQSLFKLVGDFDKNQNMLHLIYKRKYKKNNIKDQQEYFRTDQHGGFFLATDLTAI